MIYLILAVSCYVATSIFQKSASRYGEDAISVNFALRASGTMLCFALLLAVGARQGETLSGQVVLIGLASGVCTFLAGYAGLRALDFGTLNATWSIMRAATVIPVLASILVWGELRGATSVREVVVKLAGVACLFGALVLLGGGKRE